MEKLKELVLNANFEDAIENLKSMNNNDMSNILLDLAYETENIIVYSFICNLINKGEESSLHYLASEILSQPLCHYVGAYDAALYHARRAIKLDPENLSLKEYLLLFYEIPDKLVSREEAINIAKYILSKKPDSDVALQILKS